MNKYLNYLVAYLLSLAALSSCSDDNEPSPVPEPDPELPWDCDWLPPEYEGVCRCGADWDCDACACCCAAFSLAISAWLKLD